MVSIGHHSERTIGISHLVPHEVLGIIHCLGGKSLVQDLFALFCLLVVQESKGRPIFAHAVVKLFLLVPLVLIVVDFVVRLWVGKVYLASGP